MRICNQWWYRQNFRMPTLSLRLLWMYRETCCENTSRNSQNFLNNRNWPNYASTLLSRRILEKDNNPSILHCTWWRRNWWNEDILSRVHITSKWRSIPRETVDSWKHEGRPSLGWIFAFIQDVTVLRSWSNLCFETEQFLGFASWTESTNTWPKRQKQFLLQALRTEAHFYLRHDETILRGGDGAARFDDLAEKFKARFDGASQWSVEAWITFLAKGGRPKKRFQCCLTSQFFQTFPVFPNNSGTFRRYSRWSYIARQCAVAGWLRRVHIPRREREWMNSIIRVDWSQEEEASKRTDNQYFSQQWIWWTTIKIWKKLNTIWRNPESQCTTNTWGAHPKTVYWCNLKLAQRKGLQFFQTRPHAITLFNTLPAICIENVVYMKTGEELSCKFFKSRRLPRWTYAKFAIWTSGSVLSRSEKLHRPSKRTMRGQGNLSLTFRGHTASWRKSATKVQGNLSR